MDKGINMQMAPGDRLSRRKFLKDAGVGLSLTLSGMKASDQLAAANTGPHESDTPGESSSPFRSILAILIIIYSVANRQS